MAWVVLVVSGALEAVCARALSKLSGPKSFGLILAFIFGIVGSVGGLAIAMITIPTGTAYAVWAGIGATTTVLWTVWQREETLTLWKTVFLTLLIVSVVGLKVVS